MRRARLVSLLLLPSLPAWGCGDGGSAGPADVPDDAGEAVPDGSDDGGGSPGEAGDVPEEDASPDVPADTADEADAGDEIEADAADGDGAGEGGDAPAEYVRGSLASCPLDPACRRVFVTSHMGAWTVAIPGNSMAAYARAFDLGADAIEADIRVSRDGVPFMIHNDEIALYESLMCAGRIVSESDSSDIDGCLLLPSLTETIPTFAELVEWARGRILIHLDVKETDDIAAMVGAIIEHGAEDFVYIAASTGEVATVLPSIPDSDRVRFLLRIRSVADVDSGLTTLRRPNVFLFEGDRSWDDPPVDETAMIAQIARVQDAGLRIMASSDTYLPTVEDHRHLFDMGFDMVLSYDAEAGVAAARAVNAERGYPP